MARPQPAEPVKLFVALLWSDESVLAHAVERMLSQWGEIDFAGPDHPFDITRYYETEMGRDIRRRLVSFRELAASESIREAKLISNDIEDALALREGRKVNLDIGYLDHGKVVLASAKSAGQKIHLGSGIYADMILRYRDGRYLPFEWTFPDFRDGRYDQELRAIRHKYLSQLKALRATAKKPGSL